MAKSWLGDNNTCIVKFGKSMIYKDLNSMGSRQVRVSFVSKLLATGRRSKQAYAHDEKILKDYKA